MHSQAKIVRFACENEIALNPSADSSLDSRSIVIALNGDIEGAIFNVQSYRDYISNTRASQAQAWIDALESGENPFTD